MAAPSGARESALPESLEVFVRQQRIQAHALPDQSLLLFDAATGTSIPLNDSGARIWGMCDGNHTINQIVENLAAHYDAEPSRIDRDTRDFLAVLIGHGLIERQQHS